MQLLGFLSDESGAITVDWTVLTASTVALSAAVLIAISEGGLASVVSDTGAGFESAETADAPDMLALGGNLYYSGACDPSGHWCVFDTTGDGVIDSESADNGTTITPMPAHDYLTVNEMVTDHGFSLY